MDGLLFKDNIFPVDEYIPWAFGKTEIIGLNAVSLPKNTYWTLDPPILKPVAHFSLSQYLFIIKI
jgi:hypothetical protein